MRALSIVSQLNIVHRDRISDPYRSRDLEGLTIGVTKTQAQKCNRCWIYSESVGTDTEHPTICGRCLQTLRTT
ncbi:MAG: zinc finger domain-containing protein [Syntrophales bacterium]|nr:zinc finger domain-containing protein [Syntrophales bacterium]